MECVLTCQILCSTALRSRRVMFISLNYVRDKHYSQQLPQTLKQEACVEYYNAICYLSQQQREFITEKISF